MKFITTLQILLILSFSSLWSTAQSNPQQLVLNMDCQSVLPPMFRMSTDILEIPSQSYSQAKSFADLNASASGQFSENSLDIMLEAFPTKRVVIVDLREESHGFLNGIAVSWRGVNDWGNVGKTVEEIEQDQELKLQQLLQQRYVLIHDKDHPRAVYSLYVNKVCSEEELVHSKGITYRHFPVTNHIRPSDATVDAFIQFINQLPSDTWVHFHCSAGKGRATTFFALYDMLCNGKELTVDQIFMRQQLIGGKDFNLPVDPTLWKYPLALERIQFLQQFHRYCQECDPRVTSWSEWLGDWGLI